MYIHSKYFTHKLKFVSQGVRPKAFPEFYKYVSIEYDHTDNCLYLRSFGDGTHLRTRLGMCEDDSVILGTKNKPIGSFDHVLTMRSWSKVNDQLKISIDYDKMQLTIESARGKTREALISANSFVEFPDYGEIKDVPVPSEFGKCIATTIWAADKSNIDVRCKGVFFTNESGFLEVAATDRNVIALSQSTDNVGLIEVEGIIGMESAEIMKDLLLSKKDCQMSSAEDGLVLICEDEEMATQLFDDQMVAYENFIQHAESVPDRATVRLSREHLVEACSFIAPYCDLDKMSMKFNGNTVDIIGELTGKQKKGRQSIPYICDEGDASGCQVHTTSTRMLQSIKDLESDEIKMVFPEQSPKQMFIYPVSAEEDIDTTILSVLLNPDSVPQEPTGTKKRKKKKNSKHRDQ